MEKEAFVMKGLVPKEVDSTVAKPVAEAVWLVCCIVENKGVMTNLGWLATQQSMLVVASSSWIELMCNSPLCHTREWVAIVIGLATSKGLAAVPVWCCVGIHHWTLCQFGAGGCNQLQMAKCQTAGNGVGTETRSGLCGSVTWPTTGASFESLVVHCLTENMAVTFSSTQCWAG